MKKRNILLVHNYYKQRGGEDTVFENEKQMLIDNGYNVIEYTRNNSEIDKFNVFQKILLPFTTIFSFKTYREIKKIIKKNNVDLIHVHNTLNLISPSIYYVAKKMNVPIIQTVHNFRLLCPNGLFYRDGSICEDCPNEGLKCAVTHKCYRSSKLQTLINILMLKIHRFTKIYKYVSFIFLTEFNKNKFIEYNKKLNIFDENKFYVKPNFTQKNELYDEKVKKKNQYVYVGRLEENKGIKEVVESWKNIKNSKLIICGTGGLEQWLKEYIENNQLNVEFKGFVEKEDFQKVLKESKALIFSSLLYEGFPMTILESLSVNVPVIAKNIGNAANLVNNSCGIKYNEASELVDIINNDKIKLRDVIVREEFYEKQNCKLLVEIYDVIIKKREV